MKKGKKKSKLQQNSVFPQTAKVISTDYFAFQPITHRLLNGLTLPFGKAGLQYGENGIVWQSLQKPASGERR